MKHFIDTSEKSSKELSKLIERALYFKNTESHPTYPEFSVAHLFYEHSTRTRVSFELAAKKLSMTVINLDPSTSSEQKGEEAQDTIKTLVAMGIRCFVVRHVQEGFPEMLADVCGDRAHIINAGDGTHAHPSQAMLDLMTIVEEKPDLASLKIAVLGNVRHSRVAHSFQLACSLLGVGDLVMVAPEIWQPKTLQYGRVTDSLQEGLMGADVVMCLRVQKERLAGNEHLDLAHYRQAYALTEKHLALAKKDAMVMHPGPVNCGIEIDREVVDGPQSVILRQVQNGVFMRMAIFEHVLGKDVSR